MSTSRSILLLALCVLEGVILSSAYAGHAALALTSEKIRGLYNLEFRGYLTGQGSATVDAQNVSITGTLKDPSGNALNFTASPLKLENGRFSGSASIQGSHVDLSGRIDPPDEIVKSPRLVCTYSMGAGKSGRIAGELSSAAP